jgi:hypothetical protein
VVGRGRFQHQKKVPKDVKLWFNRFNHQHIGILWDLMGINRDFMGFFMGINRKSGIQQENRHGLVSTDKTARWMGQRPIRLSPGVENGGKHPIIYSWLVNLWLIYG